MAPALAVTGWRALFAALAVAVCWLAFDAAPPPQVDTGWDKLNHVLAFSALGCTGAFAFATGSRRSAAAVAAGLMAFGVAIELVQSQLPARTAEAADLLPDGIGIAAGLSVAWLLRRLARARAG